MPTDRTCTAPGCTAPHLARGLCRSHYSTWYHARDHGPCPVAGCDGRRRSPGVPCSMHEARVKRHGDTGTVLRPQSMDGASCAVEGCDEHAVAKMLCATHYWRVRTHGSVELPQRESRARWRIDDQGYRVRYWPDHPCANRGGRVKEHAVVMAAMLGRPLRPEETVHHRNGVRHDNRPENLELWASRHPKGQRVEDLVAFAREILDTYGEGTR